MNTTILWFRQDLRLQDNPALQAAVASAQPVICLYILSTAEHSRLGGAAKWWLHHSLVELNLALKQRGNQLILRQGDPATLLQELITQHHVQHLYWNRVYSPAHMERDRQLKAHFRAQGLVVESFNSHLLFEPWTIKTQQNNHYQIFTPFWRKGCNAGQSVRYSLSVAPSNINAVSQPIVSEDIHTWSLLPQKPNWAAQFPTWWTPGEASAQAKLSAFLAHDLQDYRRARDFPALSHTSRLSPHLHWGEIAVHRIWQDLSVRQWDKNTHLKDLEHFQSEIGWREFAYYLLYHFPQLPEKNFKTNLDHFAWQNKADFLSAWQTGQTGYPMVDAGMRELWHTGYMHNRVRMIVASFLIKDLLIDWRQGAAWFLDTLVDADLASNSMNWQWTAGCGPDAAPYFRIFNPVQQGKKFDPDGTYIRRWVPEISQLPNVTLHHPWEAEQTQLNAAKIRLGQTYPLPIVDHAQARKTALALYQRTMELKFRLRGNA